MTIPDFPGDLARVARSAGTERKARGGGRSGGNAWNARNDRRALGKEQPVADENPASSFHKRLSMSFGLGLCGWIADHVVPGSGAWI
jgi:hypothetical protein